MLKDVILRYRGSVLPQVLLSVYVVLHAANKSYYSYYLDLEHSDKDKRSLGMASTAEDTEGSVSIASGQPEIDRNMYYNLHGVLTGRHMVEKQKNNILQLKLARYFSRRKVNTNKLTFSFRNFVVVVLPLVQNHVKLVLVELVKGGWWYCQKWRYVEEINKLVR